MKTARRIPTQQNGLCVDGYTYTVIRGHISHINSQNISINCQTITPDYSTCRRPLTVSNPGGASGLDRQNLMRIKVNRIALIQELRVEHIVQHLVRMGVLNGADLKCIERGKLSSDRTRHLLDLLASKDKDTEWYKHFRWVCINGMFCC